MTRQIVSGQYTGDSRAIPFDFSSVLSGATIGSATLVASVFSGVDANPQAIIVNGGLSISGLTVTQRVSGGSPGTTYQIACTAHASGSQVVTITCFLVIFPAQP